MNDTHGETGEGWYGFDLDGTLAKYDGWKGIDHIGEPVKPMVDLIKRMHDEGKVVKIMTARVAPRPLEAGKECEEQFVVNDDGVRVYAHTFVEEWCAANLGFIPEITHQKDHLMLELYDDRVKQVVPNEGWLVEDIAKSKRQRTETVVQREYVSCEWYERFVCVLLGMAGTAILILATQTYLAATMTVPEAEQKLHDAVLEYMRAKVHERTEGLLKWEWK